MAPGLVCRDSLERDGVVVGEAYGQARLRRVEVEHGVTGFERKPVDAEAETDIAPDTEFDVSEVFLFPEIAEV